MLQTVRHPRHDFRLPDFFEGSWQDEVFVLDERFKFSDGSEDKRIWRLSFPESGKFTAECQDTVAPGIGRCVCNGCTLTYRFRLAIGQRRIVVKFADIFRLIDEGTMLNRAKVSKWGLPVGQVIVAFKRVPSVQSP